MGSHISVRAPKILQLISSHPHHHHRIHVWRLAICLGNCIYASAALQAGRSPRPYAAHADLVEHLVPLGISSDASSGNDYPGTRHCHLLGNDRGISCRARVWRPFRHGQRYAFPDVIEHTEGPDADGADLLQTLNMRQCANTWRLYTSQWLFCEYRYTYRLACKALTRQRCLSC